MSGLERDFILSEQTRMSARFLPGLITSLEPSKRSLTNQVKSRERCDSFHKVVGSNGDRGERYRVPTMG